MRSPLLETWQRLGSKKTMKERPILFSGPMVRAILDGRKTCTRRIMKPQLPTSYQFGGFTMSTHSDRFDSAGVQYRCPYGNTGDLLWVRETFCDSPDGPIYRASESDAGMLNSGDRIIWKPSIFMPKKYARIWLEIYTVRVERLQDISREDAKAEGCEHPLKGSELEGVSGDHVADERTSFAILWESINGKGSWDENPWVWVVEFKRVERKAEAA